MMIPINKFLTGANLTRGVPRCPEASESSSEGIRVHFREGIRRGNDRNQDSGQFLSNALDKKIARRTAQQQLNGKAYGFSALQRHSYSLPTTANDNDKNYLKSGPILSKQLGAPQTAS